MTKYCDKLDFVAFLLGAAGMSEAYGNAGQIIASAALIAGGLYFMAKGEKKHAKGENIRRDNSARPYFMH